MFRRLFPEKTNGQIEPLIQRIKKRPVYFLIVFICIINISLIAINIGIWSIAAYQKLYIASDFTVYYTAFTMVRKGLSNGLYDQEIESKYQQEILGGSSFEGGWLPFPIPPFFALLFSPLSLLPQNKAYYLWSLGQLGLLIWLILLLNRLFLNWSKQEKLLLILLILSFWPLAHTFLLGQLSLFILICLIQLYKLMKESRQVKAGIWLALLIIKPQTMLIPIMVTINKRYWRIAIATAITIMIIVVSSIAFFGYKPWLQYTQLLQTMGNSFGKFGVFPYIEFTLRGTLYNLLGYSQTNLINVISISALVLGMIFVFLVWINKQTSDEHYFELAFAVMITLSVLLSMHLFDHDSLMLVLPAALFYDYLRQNNFSRKAYSILVLISPTVFFVAGFNSFNFFGFIRPPVVVIFFLLVWMVYYLLDRNPHELQAPSIQ